MTEEDFLNCEIVDLQAKLAAIRAELTKANEENGRLREALLDISSIKDQDCYAVAVAKEALK